MSTLEIFVRIIMIAGSDGSWDSMGISEKQVRYSYIQVPKEGSV